MINLLQVLTKNKFSWSQKACRWKGLHFKELSFKASLRRFLLAPIPRKRSDSTTPSPLGPWHFPKFPYVESGRVSTRRYLCELQVRLLHHKRFGTKLSWFICVCYVFFVWADCFIKCRVLLFAANPQCHHWKPPNQVSHLEGGTGDRKLVCDRSFALLLRICSSLRAPIR